MMIEYPKIHSPWKRDPKTHKFIFEKWSCPEFEYLADNFWVCYEKLDGMNVRVSFSPDGKEAIFKGRTDKAELRPELLEFLDRHFSSNELTILSGHDTKPDEVVLFGEGLGPKIQKGGNLSPTYQFVLFDVRIGPVWLKREQVELFAQYFNVQVAPCLGRGTLWRALEIVENGFESCLKGAKPGTKAEGMVLRPQFELLDRMGRRIITKMKTKDFEEN